jgi:hypothetical protein
MPDGTELEMGPGDAFEISPGHDAWVVGEDPSVSVPQPSSTWSTGQDWPSRTGPSRLKGISGARQLYRVAWSVPGPQKGFVTMSQVITIRLARPITRTSSGRSAARAAASTSSLFGAAGGSPGLGLRT